MQLFAHTQSHPGVKLDDTHIKALTEMFFVLWGIPSISFTLLLLHGSLQVMIGQWRHGILTQNPLCDVDGSRLHPPFCAWLFCEPSMPCAPLTQWRSWLSHSPPPEWLKHCWAISPLSAPAHSGGGLANCVNALSSLFCSGLSVFPSPLYLPLPLAKAHARSLHSFLFTLPVAFAPAARENSQVEMSSHVLWSVVRCVPLQAAGFDWKHVHHKRLF